MQSKLTEYQQKIAVAIKVDKTKDEALKRLSETNSRFALNFLVPLIHLTNRFQSTCQKQSSGTEDDRLRNQIE